MKQRWVALAVVASSIVAAVTCVHDDLVECGAGIACPGGLRCVSDPALPHPTCASNDQVEACTEHATGDACVVGLAPGTCFDGACLPALCGDRIVDAIEACDDGNTVGSDGCSANCASTEKCGDGIVDLLANEQCDDGVAGVSGDGCSSQCKIEYLMWRDVTPPLITARYGFAFESAPNGDVLLFGGTLGSGTVAAFSESWEWDGVSWLRLSPPTKPPPLFRMASTYDPRRHRVVAFGGVDATGARTDATWEFDGVTWIERTPAVRPPPLEDASLACSDTSCILFGGRAANGDAGVTDETWIWDGDSWMQTAPPLRPTARSGAALVYDPARAHYVLWGGTSGSGAHTVDTWDMTTPADAWHARSTSPPPSPNTTAVASAYSSTANAVFVLGDGQPYQYVSNWSAAPALPNQSQTALAWSDADQRLVATSGSLAMHELDTGWLARSSARPLGQRANAVYDSARGLTIVWEQSTGTWEWNGSGWRRTVASNVASRPTADQAAMVFDETCGDAIVYGGNRSGTLVSDTWSYDGAMWQKLAIVGPQARWMHAMAYDPVRKATILFGGSLDASTNAVAETWQLAGPCSARTWSRIDIPGPPARDLTAMAFDRARGVVILFGGLIGGGTLADTWQFDGAWTQLASSGPPARYDHAMAFDPKRNEIVVVSGFADAQTRLADVWSWTGTAWHDGAPLGSSPARGGASLALDRTGSLILYGGDNASGSASTDLQRLRFDQGLHASERCQVATDDFDGDGLQGCADPDCVGRCAHCGDGTCTSVEDHVLCPADCQ